MPWFRTSWCYECGWEGLLRHGNTRPPAFVTRHSVLQAPRSAPVKGKRR
jgi:hypothetical protein